MTHFKEWNWKSWSWLLFAAVITTVVGETVLELGAKQVAILILMILGLINGLVIETIT